MKNDSRLHPVTESGMDERSVRLLGEEVFARLRAAKVAVLGLGGVGGAALEALARSGIGELLICDYDKIEVSNFNRQLIAELDRLGQTKVEAWTQRLALIRPDLKLTPHHLRLTPENLGELHLEKYDAVLDCLDTVSVKIALAVEAEKKAYRLLSSGGMAKRRDPASLRFGDIYETKGDPLFRIMRRALRREGVKALEVLYSEETIDPAVEARSEGALPSMIFVPMTAGLRLAQRAVESLL